jgi:hypothetical protein
MRLFIEIENGQPKNHPALEENLIQAFGVVPQNWESFSRVERPALGLYEALVSDEPTYAKVNDVWIDVWTIRSMTAEEKAAVQQSIKDSFNSREYAENWAAWVFDEAKGAMIPPIPRPATNQAKRDAQIYTYWCGLDGNWKDTPVRPENSQKFNFLTWQWI